MIQVRQTRIQHCPDIPPGFYWYGGKQSGPGWPAKWTNNINEKKTNIKKMETVPVPKTQLKHKNTNPSNHLPRINSHLKPQIDKSTLSHVTTPYETRLHA